MKTLRLTNEEHTALLEILDLAVKAYGLKLAQPCMILAQKIQEAQDVQQEIYQPKDYVVE